MADDGLTPAAIERLARRARGAGLAALELTVGGTTLRLRLDPAPPAGAGAEACPAGGAPIRSPGVGRFHHRHPLTGQPASEAGKAVRAGQVVGFLLSGPCLRPVSAPRNGVIGPPLREDGAAVGFDAPLFPLA